MLGIPTAVFVLAMANSPRRRQNTTHRKSSDTTLTKKDKRTEEPQNIYEEMERKTPQHCYGTTAVTEIKSVEKSSQVNTKRI